MENELVKRVAEALSAEALSLQERGHISWDEMARTAIRATAPAIEKAFRAGFDAGSDYATDWEMDREGRSARDEEKYPDEDESWRRYATSLKG